MPTNPLFGSKVTFAYNTIIRAHAASSPSLALSLFSRMRRAGVSPDHFTFPSVLKACSRLQSGLHLHSLIIKLAFDTNIYAQNALINLYGCSGLVNVAFKVFDEMLERDFISWSSIIACFANNGFSQEALALFQQMQLDDNVKPDEVTMLSVVSAISNLGALELGRWVDAYISRNNLVLTVSLGTSLIDMYSRCGSIEDSIRVFDEMPHRNVLTWTALINGLAVHGRSKEAIGVFNEMKETYLRPDHVTFTGVLVACSHGGLVDDGRLIFKSIKSKYGREPTLEHYGCMVDLLGRAGKLEEAFEFVETMPYKPNSVIWRTLLGACVIHKNLVFAEIVKKKIHQLDPYHDGDFVLLSNAYGEIGRYNDKAEVRRSMREKKIGKKPGYSVLHIDEEIHEFVSGDRSHPESEEIRNFLVCVIDSLRDEGYNPHVSNVFHDIEEEEKEHSLNYHSEKLAVAFSLLRFKDRRSIRIMKNIRTCHDCHGFMKHVSSKFNKEIIVRDRNRFHHFRNGACSCQDFW
ncbi:pentatricopeptide repeat-containing protein At4g21065-like [Euphorbia lathyris]|uniref:pentatricopeptide repeat-containing protein At4g21065-like n=1 Tax=Euphorbia lathyris TaxID=212925 RepID=UPI003313FC3B